MTIDLNADAGESFGAWKLGRDAELFPLVSSVNVACGFHAGDPLTMRQTVQLAVRNQIAIGAHPGFADLPGFGRREIAATPDEVYADVLYQVGALSSFLKAARVPLHHIKAHGALYNRAAKDAPTAMAIAQAANDIDASIPLVVLPNTPLETEAQAVGLTTIVEGFPERGYTADGRLAPRGTVGAWIHDPLEAAQRAVQMVTRGTVTAVDGQVVPVRTQTLCIHGDNPNAVEIAQAVRKALEAEGIAIQTY